MIRPCFRSALFGRVEQSHGQAGNAQSLRPHRRARQFQRRGGGVHGEKLEQTELPKEEWAQIVKDAEGFWDEIAGESERARKVVEIFKKYAADQEKAGYPYR
ncbi:hypothetical protein L610_001200000940 [Aminobacter sp. J44]|nr:hypothetical protein L610_001200000940 [Aminobacter sp. J44]